MELRLARRMNSVKSSEIRELLKLTERPEVISFAGGLPAPEMFPLEEIKRVSRMVLEEEGARALQYSPTEGYAPLRQWIAERLNKKQGLKLDADNVLITSGSQQALDLSGKLFLDEDDIVACESPTYLAAITAFRAYGCAFAEIPTDNEGMLPEALEQVLASSERIKLIYAIPDFQNPSGRCWSMERRKALAALAQRHGVPVLEDNPYGELRFEGEELPSLISMDREGCILNTGTFSKIFCPGYRVGWIAGPKDLIRQYVIVKQGTDLQSNTLAQMELYKYLELYDIDEHIEKMRAVYKRRCDLMLEGMASEFPSSVHFTRPQGGLFAWVEMPEEVNARELLERCLKEDVAFVPGGAFFPNSCKENTFRINFSNMPEERITEGVKRLGKAMRSMVA